MELIEGKHYFITKTERIDKFQSKRYVDHSLEQWRHVVLMGRLDDISPSMVKLYLIGNNFEKDGECYVFSKDQLIISPDRNTYRTLEDHGSLEGLGIWK